MMQLWLKRIVRSRRAKSQLNKKRAELVSKVESEKDDADPFELSCIMI